MNRSHQRGAATLLIALILLCLMLVVLATANRHLLLELRMAANQERSAIAFETADAGLAWAEVMINVPAPAAADCTAAASGTSLRERVLSFNAGLVLPQPVRPACARGDAGWTCSCPTSGEATLPAHDSAFTLDFVAVNRPGVLQVVATGRTARGEAVARHQALLALQPAMAHPPAAALTVRGSAETSDAFFATHFGLSKEQWGAQPAVQRLDCRGDCTAALREATSTPRHTLFAIDGDVRLQGPLALGSAERPVLIVATGAIHLDGAVTLNGVLYGSALSWSGSGAVLRGALLSEGAATGASGLDLAREPTVLDTLQLKSGSFVRLPGSWRDF